MDRLLLNVEEAARQLGLSRSQVYAMVARSDLPSVKIGRVVRVPSDALQEWIKRNTMGETSS